MRRGLFLSMAGPSIVVMFGLMVIPLLGGAYLSLHSFTFRGDLRWQGLANYADTFADPDFWMAMRFTLLVCFVSVPCSLLVGFVSALLLTRLPKWLRGIVIACVLLPFVVTPVVGTLAFSWLFRDFGVVNYWLQEMGIHVFWMGSDLASQSLVILHSIWASAPFASIVLYAALQTVPPEQLEAAQIDGASKWERMRFVVLPHLGSVFVFLTVIKVQDAYRIFDSIAVMTKGINGTESVMWYSYRIAILENALTRGTAIAFLTVIGILILLLPFLWITWKEQRAI